MIDPQDAYSLGQWYYDVLKGSGSRNMPVDDERWVREVASKVWDLAGAGKFEAINLMLQYVDPGGLPSKVAMAFLVATKEYRQHLPARPALWGRMTRQMVMDYGVERAWDVLKELL